MSNTDVCIDCHASYPDGRPAWTETPNGHHLCMGCRNALQWPCQGNDQRPFIEIDPDIHGGDPCLGHSRLNASIAARWATRDGIADAVANYPGHTAEEFRLAQWFAKAYELRRRGGVAGYIRHLEDWRAGR